MTSAVSADRNAPAGLPGRAALLSVRDLRVTLLAAGGTIAAVRGVSLDVSEGESLAVVGESGSGKSVTFLSLLGLLPKIVPCTITGDIHFEGRDLTRLSTEALRQIRGRKVAMIFQDPLSALNPVLKIGNQIADVIQAHERGISRAVAWRRAVEALETVRIPDAGSRASDYPYQFSGGMRQRVLIAMAVVCRPRILIADEPTTALDVTIQAQILDLLDTLRRDLNMGLVLITHDLGLVARYSGRVAVMYAGSIVEQGTVRAIFSQSRHPYSVSLLASMPRIADGKGVRLASIPGVPPNLQTKPLGCTFRPRCFLTAGRSQCADLTPALVAVGHQHSAACHFSPELAAKSPAIGKAPMPVNVGPINNDVLDTNAPPYVVIEGSLAVLRVDGLTKRFTVRSDWFGGKRAEVHAVDDVSFDLRPGETIGIVGESGSGKSTLARLIVRLIEPSAGRVMVEGTDITALSHSQLQAVRDRMQVMFQDSRASLNPRMTIEAIVGEPLVIRGKWGSVGREHVHQALARVGLGPQHAKRLPHEFSGGQQQRIGLARALILEPQLLVLDEPISSLDVSIRAQMINLLQDLQAELRLSYVFIAHDLSVVHHISDRIAVMYLGRIVELGDADLICQKPLHPYTANLIEAIPQPDPSAENSRRRTLVTGGLPDPIDRPSGCAFHTRCQLAMAIGINETQDTVEVQGKRLPRRCVEERPPLCQHRRLGWAACHYAMRS